MFLPPAGHTLHYQLPGAGMTEDCADVGNSCDTLPALRVAGTAFPSGGLARAVVYVEHLSLSGVDTRLYTLGSRRWNVEGDAYYKEHTLGVVGVACSETDWLFGAGAPRPSGQVAAACDGPCLLLPLS